MNDLFPEYRRDINVIQMTLPDRSPGQDDYQYEMLSHNKIQGLLPVVKQFKNGLGVYCYDISNKISISKLFENREMEYLEVRSLIVGLKLMIGRIKEYLLDENNILLHPDYIFMDMEKNNVWFVFYPSAYEFYQYIKEFRELSEFLLSRVNHKDEYALELVYGLFRETRNDNFTLQTVMNSILKYDLERSKEKINEQENIELNSYQVKEHPIDENLQVTFALKDQNINRVDKTKAKKSIDPPYENSMKKIESKHLCIIITLTCVFLLLCIVGYTLFITEEEPSLREYLLAVFCFTVPSLMWINLWQQIHYNNTLKQRKD